MPFLLRQASTGDWYRMDIPSRQIHLTDQTGQLIASTAYPGTSAWNFIFHSWLDKSFQNLTNQVARRGGVIPLAQYAPTYAHAGQPADVVGLDESVNSIFGEARLS